MGEERTVRERAMEVAATATSAGWWTNATAAAFVESTTTEDQVAAWERIVDECEEMEAS